MSGLHVGLDAPLPDRVAIGAGTALFVCGWVTATNGKRVRALHVEVDGEPQALTAHGMPRLDVLEAMRPGQDPYATANDPAYRSGFWGVVRIGPRAAGGTCWLALRATLEDGMSVAAPLAEIAVAATRTEPAARPRPADGAGPLVAVCMATFEPDMALFAAQVESIRAQDYPRWVCIVSDDCSSPERYAEIEAAIGDDPRFALSRSAERLGFYRNFERCLGLVGGDVDLVAPADQDDVWHPDKLSALVASLGDARLAYSDARVVAADGTVLADTYWQRRRNNHEDLLSLLVANAVTGAASLFPRGLLDDALPFPPAQFAHFHDHWLGLVALASGDIAFVDRPLYDYVQHGQASLGHAAANQLRTLRSRAAGLRGDPRERVRMWRLRYFVDVARLTQLTTILELRLGPRLSPRKRRVIERWLRTDASLPALARLWVHGARELVGRPETLGAEWMLGSAFLWRRLLEASARDRPVRGVRLDALPPTTLAPPPGRSTPDVPLLRAMEDKVAPLRLAVRDDVPPRVNLLIPQVDLQHFFGGYIAKFNLARRLAERGLRVRLVTVDPQSPQPPDWRRRVEAYAGLDGVLDRVEVAFGREAPGGLEVSRSDRWIATTWWTAHVAHAATRELGGGPFVYLIQEYEPFTFTPGSWAALAAESYAFPHAALFSTALLRDWFRLRGIGVFATGAPSAAFENAITVVPPPSAQDLAARRSRRLLFYARPEPHASRNLYELGVLALHQALGRGAFAGWALHGVGTLSTGQSLELGRGMRLDLLPRSAQASYADVLRDHDVGLALMYTPHPSLVPIEMASAGMLTVTSTFENKTADALATISTNLLAAEPTVEAIADALVEASAAAGDHERRAAGADVAWSRDWDRSFGDALLDEVTAWLDVPARA